MSQPHIIFIFSDQQHWQALQSEDASFVTPHLQALLEDGVQFTQAFCTCPQCSPSRSSLLTGRYPSKTGVIGNIGAAGGDDLRIPTIGAYLQEAGYHTAYYGKWHLGDDEVGCAGWDDYFFKIDDQAVAERATHFIQQIHNQEKPCALFVSFNNPHDIYHFKKDEDRLTGVDLPRSWHEQDFSTVPSIQEQFMREDQGAAIVDETQPMWEHYRAFYRMKTKLYDDSVGLLVQALKQQGLYDDSLVISTSDHGDMDAQHKLIFKGPFMYDQLMRVPLIIKAPLSEQALRGHRHDYLNVNVDVVPTIADFAGAAIAALDGNSLRSCLHGEIGPDREYIIGQYYSKQSWVNPMRMIRTNEFKYTISQEFGEELYSAQDDADELQNIAQDPAFAAIKHELRTQLDQWIQKQDDPFYQQVASTRSGEPLYQSK